MYAIRSYYDHTSFFSPNQLVVRKLPVISTTDEEQIREILINMINIQGILARHYFYQRELGSSSIEDYSFFITNKMDDEALMFSMIFDSVTVTKTKYGEPCGLQVNDAKDIAYKVFERMIKEKLVNVITSYSIHYTKLYDQKSC